MPQSDREIAETQDAGDPDRWEKGEIRRAKDVTVTLSFRVNEHLAAEIEDFADSHQMSVSDVLRRAVERYLELSEGTTFVNMYFSIAGTSWKADLTTGGPTAMSMRGTWSSGGSKMISPAPRLPLLDYGAELEQAAN